MLMYGSREANKNEVRYSGDSIVRCCAEKAETSLVGSLAHAIHHLHLCYFWKQNKGRKGKRKRKTSLQRPARKRSDWGM